MRVLLFYAIILLISLLSFQSTNGQGVFAPSGASWHHEMPYGSFHSFTDGDTLILGRTSKRIRQIALTKQPEFSQGLHVHNLPDRYMYEDNDTVFVYNTIFHKFTPLYIFNAADGDTICLPVLPTDPGTLFGGFTDSSFCFVVDSVRLKKYDTAFLRTFFTRDIGVPGTNYRMNWGTDNVGAYAETIGGVYSGLLPHCFSCAFALSDQIQGAGILRCYSDPSTTLKLVTDDCDDGGIASAVQDPEPTQRLIIAPIPANDVIYIKSEHPLNIRCLDIINSQGERVFSKINFEGSAIPVSHLQNGLYFIRMSFRDGPTITEKFIIRHE